nr:hypothetical protein Iba_chr15cCG4780 [Ipomoea batatas]GMD98757.1 hypothetical protein Iba_chr15dCG5820 [Ipomoea batatas]GME00437.1 hypothetical protein Iba_chr15fCG5390 [Ipomoea batatas]
MLRSAKSKDSKATWKGPGGQQVYIASTNNFVKPLNVAIDSFIIPIRIYSGIYPTTTLVPLV